MKKVYLIQENSTKNKYAAKTFKKASKDSKNYVINIKLKKGQKNNFCFFFFSKRFSMSCI